MAFARHTCHSQPEMAGAQCCHPSRWQVAIDRWLRRLSGHHAILFWELASRYQDAEAQDEARRAEERSGSGSLMAFHPKICPKKHGLPESPLTSDCSMFKPLPTCVMLSLRSNRGSSILLPGRRTRFSLRKESCPTLNHCTDRSGTPEPWSMQ